jgi:prenyltransferase beta subunit
MKRLILLSVPIATLLFFSLIFPTAFAHELSETRQSALVETLSQSQLESGAFRFFRNITGTDYFNEGGTCSALTVLNVLGAFDKVSVGRAATYLASAQLDQGGFGKFPGQQDYDMDFTYDVVRTLRTLNALDQINQTAAAGFMLARYNASTGAFHELLAESNGSQYAMSHFALGFSSWNAHMAYAVPNVISTYLGTSTLAELGLLHLLNATKTYEWLMSCRAGNGAFKPFPNASYSGLPGWSSLITNPFRVDRDGTGVPYTFAAVQALKNLGRLDSLSSQDREEIMQYLLSSQAKDGNFYIHPDYDDKKLAYAYYAVMTLLDLGLIQAAENNTAKTTNHLIHDDYVQMLYLDNSWPIPQSRYHDFASFGLYADQYGLFHETSTDANTDTFYAVSILNATGSLALLDQPTPKALIASFNLTVLSVILTLIITAVPITLYVILQKRKTQKKSLAAEPATPQPK